MKTPKDPPEKNADLLDALVDEAREGMTPPVMDWAAMERRLEARLASEEAPRLARMRAPGIGGRFLALGVAAAAAAVLVVARDRDAGPLGPTASATSENASGGTLRVTQGAGDGRAADVRVGGVVAETGLGLRAGDLVEVTAGRAVFERPRKVTWLLEGDDGPGHGRARVSAATEPVILALEEGAIEAQVTRSDAPESFAVDVTAGGHTVRVAVHGTHLRVLRAGSRVVVDLSEGVVSIGVPPRVGPTYGTLVTAPAHVELEVEDPAGSIKIDHARESVRTPVPLGPGDLAAMLAREPAVTAAGAPRTAADSPGVATPPPPGNSGVVEAPSHNKAEAPGAATPPPRLATTSDVANAVRECVVAVRKTRPEVKVTVSSTLRLRVSPSGDVQSVVFDPPLAPEVQTCAAGRIYPTKLDANGAVDVPVQLSY